LDYNDTDWSGAPISENVQPVSDTTANTSSVTITGTWYYSDGTGINYGNLVELDANKETAPIFKGIELPKALTNDFKDLKFSLDLTAYAVQSENNTPEGEGLAALESVFKVLDESAE
jgi:hypothetical protein